ncbi:MAG: ABC transporter permease [Ginsengibacter sp.]
MFTNYFKIAWRKIQKNKLYSFINILGLSTGLAACILIGLYVFNELSYDKFNTNSERIARVTMEYGSGGSSEQTAVTGNKVGPQLKRTFPLVDSYVRTMKSSRVISNGSNAFDEKNILYADADFFKVFSFKLLQGNDSLALSDPYSIVLTKSVAKKYFGNENPIGKTLRIDDVRDYVITGIVADPPINSQIKYDILLSFKSLASAKDEVWFNANYVTYLLLHKPSQITRLQQQINAYMKDVSKNELKTNNGDFLSLKLEPFEKVHLYSSLNGGLEPNGSIMYVYVLGIIALLILLIACVNYTNLSTAQSMQRSTEIGIRKVLGAGRSRLFWQYIGESAIITALSILLAFLFSIILLPLFSSVTGSNFSIVNLLQPSTIIMVIAFGIVASFLAGAYPAFAISRIGLVKILKSGFHGSSSGGVLRKSLIVFQFTISVFLIIVTIAVLRQLSFIQKKDLGFDKNQVLVLPVNYKMKEGYEALKKAVSLSPGVLSVTGAYDDPVFVQWGDGIAADNGKNQKKLSVTAMPVDLDFIKTMDMKIVAGTTFTPADFLLQDTANDNKNYRSTFILNEKAVRDLGWTSEDAIGKTISKGQEGTIKAVVKDFHFSSMHSPIGPLVIFLDTSHIREILVKIKADNVASTLSALKSTWNDRVPYRPFEYHFLDESFEKIYTTEQRAGKVFTIFSLVAIILACLGLFALAAFSTLQRTKEIGIRKVLGAGVGNIAFMVSKEFITLIIVAIVIASPIAWYLGNQWLQGFAYRTSLSWWIFIVSGLAALFIAMTTVSYHAIKSAKANPVESLRTE